MTDSPMPDPFEPDEGTQQLIRDIVEKLGDQTRKIGLYLEGVGVMSHPDQPSALTAVRNAESFKEAVQSGEANVVVVGTFVVGDIAFATRTLDPEQEEIDNAAREILPDPVEEMKEKLRRAQAEGKSIFDIEDE
jgi:hypothetical protein